MRILVAEDDRTSRRILQALIPKWGHEITAVEDGRQAWDRLTAGEVPDLMITDWMMPGMSGAELCERIRGELNNPALYIILLTALSDKESVVKGLESGANDYIGKPFNQAELAARIRVGERVVSLQTALTQRVEELEQALEHVKTLQGLLPICSHCHKIRTKNQDWQRLEGYIEDHSDAQFSHSICDECLAKHYPENDNFDIVNEGSENDPAA